MPRSRSSVLPSPVIEPIDADSPYANAPTRATGNLILGFATTAIPCNVYSGTEDNGLKRGEWIEAGEDNPDEQYLKVGRASIIKGTDVIVPSSAVVKLAESSDGTLVPLSDDEIAAAIGCEGGFCAVEQFLPLSVMNAGTYIVDSLYQLRPAPARSGGTNRRSETTNAAFALLIKAMRVEGVFGLCRVALRGKPRYAAFMPDGRLYTLRFTNEVRLPLALPQIEVSDADLMLARMVVASRTSNIAPMLRDTSTEQVRQYVDDKAALVERTPVVLPAPDRSYEDMITALRESVQGMSLPMQTDPQPVMPSASSERLTVGAVRDMARQVRQTVSGPGDVFRIMDDRIAMTTSASTF